MTSSPNQPMTLSLTATRIQNKIIPISNTVFCFFFFDNSCTCCLLYLYPSHLCLGRWESPRHLWTIKFNVKCDAFLYLLLPASSSLSKPIQSIINQSHQGVHYWLPGLFRHSFLQFRWALQTHKFHHFQYGNNKMSKIEVYEINIF